MNLGAWMKKRRRALGLTQSVLAQRLGEDKDQTYVSRVENGKTNISIGEVEAIGAALLDVPGALAAALGKDSLPSTVVAKQEGLTVTDAGGRTWSVVARLGDPASPFVLSPEAAKVLAAIGVLGEPKEPPAVPGGEGEGIEDEGQA